MIGLGWAGKWLKRGGGTFFIGNTPSNRSQSNKIERIILQFELVCSTKRQKLEPMSFHVTETGKIVFSIHPDYVQAWRPAPLKHVKGDWTKYIGCWTGRETGAEWLYVDTHLDLLRGVELARRWVVQAEAEGLPAEDSAYEFDTPAFKANRLWRKRLEELSGVECAIVKKLRKIDATITLQTAWRARRTRRGYLVLLGGLREIDLRERERATRVIQTGWAGYKLNKRFFVLRVQHYLSEEVGLQRERSARTIQQAWAGYKRVILAEINSYRRALGMCDRTVRLM